MESVTAAWIFALILDASSLKSILDRISGADLDILDKGSFNERIFRNGARQLMSVSLVLRGDDTDYRFVSV